MDSTSFDFDVSVLPGIAGNQHRHLDDTLTFRIQLVLIPKYSSY